MSNRFLRRLSLGLATLAGLLGAQAADAVTAPVLVVEVDSGKVLYAQGATDPWYPASITKLMTTYVALDLVRQGKVSLDSMITISAAAAAEPPSKMGFKPGTQLTLDNALKIIMVKSANDVAFAIGETLGGTVDGFADMMNETARKIGMRESRWYNPNGLPDPRQWTSARDMAVLGRALLRDFPDSHDLFSISAIQFGRSVMANHNGLLGRYAGVDGMKTGFICAGGFNVVASANRNGRRILTIVMGSPSARERDLKAADLFDYGFGQSAGWTAQTLDAMPASSIGAPPDMRPYICDRKKPMPIDEGPGAIAGAAGSAGAQFLGAAGLSSSALTLATLNGAAARNRTLPPRAPLQPILVWIGRDPAEGQIMLNEQAEAEKAAAASSRTAKLEAAKAKREAALEAAKQKRAAALEAKSEAKSQGKAKPAVAGGVPRSASAYTAVDASGMPEAKHTQAHTKPATTATQKGGKPAPAKPTSAKVTPAKPTAKAKPGGAKSAAKSSAAKSSAAKSAATADE
ncbi:D-alanyl-D-alanine carboxypeptidase family protein [Methylobacterium sp. WL120]|uniref:D-alanyl-D-alanine carboxypeptidase family protein n=1 Tax=Methylobacterium sp. WL120 TaxID=2603887 RepID=UPI0011CA4E64|nr:D-alanyl-D-alanine carboxypeptidase family protein [Methylobacterium sp. WL120]TXM63761.1 D-alanyl-D-alanine carboxypeptidase [Methylobacterium sp. WL120]